MKQYIYAALALTLAPLAMTSCEDVQEGTAPGSDSNPSVVLYQYAAEETNESRIRFSSNSATESIYFLAETKDAYAAHNTDDVTYVTYILEHGTEIKVNGAANIDTTLALPGGVNYITAIAVKGDDVMLGTPVTFDSKTWTTVSGTEKYVYTSWLLGPSYATLQQCDQNRLQYRLTGLNFGSESDATFDFSVCYKIEEKDTIIYNVDGNYLLALDPHETQYIHKSYGMINIEDYAAYASEPAYRTEISANAYSTMNIEDHTIEFFCVYYSSAGRFGSKVDTFGPDEDEEEGGEESGE